jgi:hypothetical protein
MIALLLACVSMAARDCIGTFLTVAEAKGRALLAGSLDALFDIATIATTVCGAGPVIRDGLTVHALLVIGSMLIVSFVGTTCWTTLARRIGTE